jgi:hypothetical protein
METQLQSFTIASYNTEGESIGLKEVLIEQLDPAVLAAFQKKLQRLPNTLELPLEGKLPGDYPHLDFRIGSDSNGAYVLYYLHDEVVYASLYLGGRDVETEEELSQVFKFLLLDQDDADDPTEDEIEDVLSRSAFNFSEVQSRPVVFSVCFENQPNEEQEFGHIRHMDQHLAAVFLTRG